MIIAVGVPVYLNSPLRTVFYIKKVPRVSEMSHKDIRFALCVCVFLLLESTTNDLFFKHFNIVRSKTRTVFIVCGYNILPKFVNQLIASSIQIIQIDSRHLLSYYMPILLVYYYMGVFCDIWTLLFRMIL